MNHISNEDLLKLDTWIANNVPDKNFEQLFTIWVHLTAEYSRLIQQRDAALRLADKWEQYAANFREQEKEFLPSLPPNVDPPSYIHDECATDLRAIFAPKEGK